MSEYVWTNGACIKAAAQEVGHEIERVQKVHGDRMTARIYVDAARPDDSPLHPTLEWDNLRAAELYREDQARHVLACIRIVEARDANGTPSKTIRAFVNLVERVGNETQRHYVPMATVLADADLLRQAVEKAAKELAAFEDRYASFQMIADVARDARERLQRLLPVA